MRHEDGAEHPQGPDGMAMKCRARLANLKERKAACRTRAERRSVNRQIHMVQDLLNWCETRAGYTGSS